MDIDQIWANEKVCVMNLQLRLIPINLHVNWPPFVFILKFACYSLACHQRMCFYMFSLWGEIIILCSSLLSSKIIHLMKSNLMNLPFLHQIHFHFPFCYRAFWQPSVSDQMNSFLYRFYKLLQMPIFIERSSIPVPLCVN